MLGFVFHEPKATEEDKRKTFLDKCFKGRNGKVYLAAFPNAPLILWFVAEVVAMLLHGTAHKLALIVAIMLLVVWALLEIFKGANYFRRVLGLVVLVSTLFSVQGLFR